MVDQLTGFGQVSAPTMLQHLFSVYGMIDEIDLEENSVKIMVDRTIGKGEIIC